MEWRKRIKSKGKRKNLLKRSWGVCIILFYIIFNIIYLTEKLIINSVFVKRSKIKNN